MGPMTGRGAGYCAGFGVPGFVNAMPGRGRGMGLGRGRGGGRHGWRHQFYATGLPFWARTAMPGVAVPMGTEPTVEYQTEALKAQAEQLEKSLEQIRNRITELETAQSKEG
jgi:hypothetical protein